MKTTPREYGTRITVSPPDQDLVATGSWVGYAGGAGIVKLDGTDETVFAPLEWIELEKEGAR